MQLKLAHVKIICIHLFTYSLIHSIGLLIAESYHRLINQLSNQLFKQLVIQLVTQLSI